MLFIVCVCVYASEQSKGGLCLMYDGEILTGWPLSFCFFWDRNR